MKKYVHRVKAFRWDGTRNGIIRNVAKEDLEGFDFTYTDECECVRLPLGEGGKYMAKKGDYIAKSSNGQWLSWDGEEFEEMFEEVQEGEQEIPSSSVKDKFKESCKPLMDYMRDHHHPHCTAIVDCTHCEILEGLEAYSEPDNIND